MYKVEGYVYDENHSPMEYANITFLNEDSTYVTGVVTSKTGFYKVDLTLGNYTLNVSMLGYKTRNIPLHVERNQRVDDISMELHELSLGEIEITAQKSKMVTREVDRLIFDAASLQVGNNDLSDILKNVPGIIIINDEIKILGKGQVKVFINNRELKLSGKELLSMLSSYQASDINKVEVITTPPAKYDAEGEAGILNIELKKVENDYVGGNVTYNFKNDSKKSINVISTGIAYNKNRITSTLNSNVGLGKYRYEETNCKLPPK